MSIVILGEARGENEAKIKRGFVGPTGVELFKLMNEAGLVELSREDWQYISKFWNENDPTMLDMVWQLHPELYRTNVFNQRPPGNKIEAFCGPKADAIPGYPVFSKGKYIRAEFQPELDRLAEELDTVSPNLVLCLGNTACWAMLGRTTIKSLRGFITTSTHTITGFKCLPTYHPAAIFRQYELRPIVYLDLKKAAREIAFPEIRRPRREIWIEPDLADFERFFQEYIVRCDILSVDIETSGRLVTCIGFAPSIDRAIVVPFFDARKPGRSYWPTPDLERKAWDLVGKILSDASIRKVFQNGLYDIAFLWRACGLKTYGAMHDTMLLHHALQPESIKDLGFLGSCYTDEASWKKLRTKKVTIKADD